MFLSLVEIRCQREQFHPCYDGTEIYTVWKFLSLLGNFPSRIAKSTLKISQYVQGVNPF